MGGDTQVASAGWRTHCSSVNAPDWYSHSPGPVQRVCHDPCLST